jgi:hypothetical protein
VKKILKAAAAEDDEELTITCKSALMMGRGSLLNTNSQEEGGDVRG